MPCGSASLVWSPWIRRSAVSLQLDDFFHTVMALSRCSVMYISCRDSSTVVPKLPCITMNSRIGRASPLAFRS